MVNDNYFQLKAAQNIPVEQTSINIPEIENYFNTEYSIWRLKQPTESIDKIIIPDFKIKKTTKPTDLLRSIHLNQNCSILCSKGLKNLLLSFKMQEFKAYDVIVYYKNQKHNYFLIHFLEESLNLIDFNESSFSIPPISNYLDKSKNIHTQINIKSELDYKAKLATYGSIKCERLRILNHNFDVFRIGGVSMSGIYLSNKVIDKMKDENITGVFFSDEV